MDLNISWRVLVGALVTYYGTLVFYRLFLHPLAHFPGPRLAAISRWYEAFYDVVLGGQYTSKIAELHKIYGIKRFYPNIRWAPTNIKPLTGPIIRISPSPSCDCTVFSKSNVVARQDLLRRNIDKLCQRISKLNGTAFNLGAAISAVARDNANEFIVGKAYNELDLEDFGIGLSISSQGAGTFWRTTKHVRWFGPAMRAMPIHWAEKVADEHTKSFLRYLQQSERDTRDTLAAVASSSPGHNVNNTMIYTIVHSDLPPADKTFDRIFEELATVTGAGFETTSNTLRLILYHLYTNNTILERLREEITIASDGSGPIPLKKLEQLPYLTAILQEGLRLSPGVSTRAARITDKDLFYMSWRIPTGTPVGMTTILMHTDEKLYPDPMRFNPDRWMNSATKGTITSTFAPFSRGTRMCIGMHLAWAEMYLLLAYLVKEFDFTIMNATAGDFELEKDNFGIGTKASCNLMAHVTLREG
ncbi:cytochrome P450 [Microsporum canis CBS 113480]|uniref:Cytochrome P450 n=1 Tax=Arthroderma otae (strain ATCC MYA-4605 / CBS 113480) TaxID=554155 RepID=C5FJD1_ARTOC|nr:cytochrome P450 [Microsporum canis CBS 113480]EEQ29552.1 cytochrome P450 [Microsporum canis CBS 113480]